MWVPRSTGETGAKPCTKARQYVLAGTRHRARSIARCSSKASLLSADPESINIAGSLSLTRAWLVGGARVGADRDCLVNLRRLHWLSRHAQDVPDALGYVVVWARSHDRRRLPLPHRPPGQKFFPLRDLSVRKSSQNVHLTTFSRPLPRGRSGAGLRREVSARTPPDEALKCTNPVRRDA